MRNDPVDAIHANASISWHCLQMPAFSNSATGRPHVPITAVRQDLRSAALADSVRLIDSSTRAIKQLAKDHRYVGKERALTIKLTLSSWLILKLAMVGSCGDAHSTSSSS
jgi:hypothetical protein